MKSNTKMPEVAARFESELTDDGKRVAPLALTQKRENKYKNLFTERRKKRFGKK